MAQTALPVAAAATAGLAYLDARFHVSQDLKLIWGKRKGAKLLQAAVRDKRVSLYYLFEENVRKHPDKECVWSRSGSYTWAEAYRRANQYAHFFLSNGVKPGDQVALFMANSPDFVFAWMGLWAVGAAPALINHNLSRQALLHCLSISDATMVLADGPLALLGRVDAVKEELAARGVSVVRLEGARPSIHESSGERPGDELRAGVTPGSPYGLFYTSGTTGLPKAAVVPVAAGFGFGVGRRCGYSYVQGDDQRFYNCMPLYHGTGGIHSMVQLLTGQTLCIAPRFSASGFWDDVRDSRATWFTYVGETLRYLLAAPPSPRDRDHRVHSIYGNGLRPDVWKPFRDRFGIETVYEFFNSTEGVMPLYNGCRGDFRAHAVGHHGLLERWRHRGVYQPVAVDFDTGELARDPGTGLAVPLPLDVGGEILVRQPPVPGLTPPFPGYYKNEAATGRMYVRDVLRKGDCYYRTGDAMRRDADGRWFFLDRLGDSFRWKGENVSTAEVAEVLGRFPGVGEATVYGVPLPHHDGKAGMAALYIQPEQRADFDYAGLLKHARANLPKYAVPVFLRQLEERSTTHNNKQDKKPLKLAGVEPQVPGSSVLWVGGVAAGKGQDGSDHENTYVPFTQSDFDALTGGRAKL